MSSLQPKVLFVLEGYVDIRLLTLLSKISELTLYTPANTYYTSGLDERIALAQINLDVQIIEGSRIQYQWNSLKCIWKNIKKFDLVIAQENLRGALNATFVGKLKQIPVITYTGIPPVEYFKCKRERKQVSSFHAWVGINVIKSLIYLNSKMADCCLAVGPYLQNKNSSQFKNVLQSKAYGVDTRFFSPVPSDQKLKLRLQNDLPLNSFIVFFASRVSHEKDAETMLKSVHLLRSKGVDAVALNYGGNYREFIATAKKLNLPDWPFWVLGRPAAHPTNKLNQIYQSSDVLVQSSLEEGLGLSPLEAMSCGIPSVVTSVGGMKDHIRSFTWQVEKKDSQMMCEHLYWIYSNPDKARIITLEGRRYVEESWSIKEAEDSFKRAIDLHINSEEKEISRF